MRLNIHLTPQASHNKIEGWILNEDNLPVLRIKVTTVPEKGKANNALIKLLSKTLHIPRSKITLVKGETSRMKVLNVEMDETLAFKILGSPKT